MNKWLDSLVSAPRKPFGYRADRPPARAHSRVCASLSGRKIDRADFNMNSWGDNGPAKCNYYFAAESAADSAD